MGRRARQRPEPPVRRRRERLGHEAPGSVMKGPRITVTCECGASRQLPYGETWTCEACGRRYDTRHIPAGEYEAIRRTQLRFRVLPVVLGLLVAALAIFFSLTGNVLNVFVLLPVSMVIWFSFIRPAHRRRYREAISDLPRWDLRAE